MGSTQVSQNSFHQYLSSINHLFTQSTYDLLNNNCNNFSDTVTRFLLGHGIPSYIVDLPRIVFSTPGGAMLRPMLENMQNSLRQQSSGMNSLDPFSTSNATPLATQNLNLPRSPENMNIPATSIASSSVSSSTNHSTSSTTSLSIPITPVILSPLISADSDSNMLTSMYKKITNLTNNKKKKEESSPATGVGVGVYSDEELDALKTSIDILISYNHHHNNAENPKKIREDYSIPTIAFTVLDRLMTEYPNIQTSCLFLLRLLVLHIPLNHNDNNDHSFHPMIDSTLSSALLNLINKVIIGPSAFTSISSFVLGLCTISNLLATPIGKFIVFYEEKENHNNINDNINTGNESTEPLHVRVINGASSWMSHERVEIRQMSCAILFNMTMACTMEHNHGRGKGGTESAGEGKGMERKWCTPYLVSLSDSTSNRSGTDPHNSNPSLQNHSEVEPNRTVPSPRVVSEEAQSDELDPMAVQILCSSYEGIEDEKDTVCRQRRLSTLLQLCRSNGLNASTLLSELGYVDVSQQLKKIPGVSSVENNLLLELDKIIVQT